jgi:acetoin utilization protein AcuC
MCRVGVLFGHQLTLYSFGPSHPLNSSRILKFYELLPRDFVFLDPVMAKEEEITLFHKRDYVEFVKRMSEKGFGYLDYGDTPAFKGVYEASAYVVGSTLRALDSILKGEVDHAFNPMGGLHHARRGSAAGFCVFNDIGVLFEVARKRGLNKILYIDIDAHHGDGVYYEYEEDPEIFIVDIHEDGRFLYPGTGFEWEIGKGKAEGTKLNITLQPGDGDSEFLARFEEAKKFMERINPDLVVVQCGGDCLEGDPITHLRCSSRVHKEVIRTAHEISHRKANGRLIALGGGGYNPEKVALAWVDVIKEMSHPVN